MILQKLPYLLDQGRCHIFQPRRSGSHFPALWSRRPSPSFLSQAIHQRFQLLLSTRHFLTIVDRTSRTASGTRYREFHAPKPQTGGQVAYHGVVTPHFRIELQLPSQIRYSRQGTSSNTFKMSASSYKPLRAPMPPPLPTSEVSSLPAQAPD